MQPVTDAVTCSVGLSVCHDHKPCKNGWTVWDAVWVVDSGGPKEPCVRWGSRSPWKTAILGKGATHCKLHVYGLPSMCSGDVAFVKLLWPLVIIRPYYSTG